MSQALAASDFSDNFDVDTLDLDIEGLDDAEYDLPPVEQTPTLESILNDLNERTSLSEDELSNVLLATGEVAGFEGSETHSMCSVDARSKGSEQRARKRPTPGSILRHVVLKKISSQLNSACERVDAGLPTALAVSTMIAVGTSRGRVLAFDSTQTLRWCLGGDATSAEQGSVSSLGFNNDCTRLLAGFARGNVLMYDVAGGKLIRTMTDVHAPATAVLHVKFTDSPTLALCADSGGSVFELSFRRVLGVRGCESKCLFSGSRGEVVCLEPLLLDQFVSHPLGDAVLVAMATLSKVLVVSLRPRTRVVFTHALPGRPATLPLIAWQFVVIQMSDGSRVVDPVLAFARDSDLHFYQVCVDGRGRPRLASLQHLTVTYSLLALRWLNSRTLAALDSAEQLHLIDVRTREELDCVDLANVGLVYAAGHFKGIATGGNVSKALALAGERACYNSVLSFGNQLLVLGVKNFHVLSIRSWTERLEILTNQRRFPDALALGLAFYQDQAKAVVGLKGPKQRRKEIARDKVLEILHSYMDLALQADCSAALLQEAVPICIEHCIQLEITDVLFSKLWEGCCEWEAARGVFLESLEPWILSERLTSLPPGVMQQLVSHYESLGALVPLEAMIVRLDVSCLDVDQVMRLSTAHSLLDAKIHVFNRGLADYITPLVDLLDRLQKALASGSALTDRDISHGNKLLVYVSCCLAGRGYPSGDIPASLVRNVKHEVFNCLTCLHTRDADDAELAYPYLRALLAFDAREFYNVVTLALEEPEFATEMGRRQTQRLVDVLARVTLSPDTEPSSGVAVACLVQLVARQLGNGLQLERGVLERAAALLGRGGSEQHEARQVAALDLVKLDEMQGADRGWLLELAEEAKFYRVCELLYEERGEFDRILSCYLRDPARRPQVFNYLRNLLLLSRSEDRGKVEAQLAENAAELVEVDWRQAGHLVRSLAPNLISGIAEKLEGDTLFRFLEGLVESKDEVPLEPALVERYIDLLCERNPSKVHGFLLTDVSYRLDQALQITSKWELVDAQAHLLERTGDFSAALQLLLARLDKEFDGPNTASLVTDASDLCRRASKSLDEDGRRALWLPLLETVLHHGGPETRAVTQQLLSAMSGFVALPAVVQAVLNDPSCTGGRFGDIRDLVMGMLEHSNYEKTLLESTFRLHSTDLHQRLAGVLAANNRGLSPRSVNCSLCRKPLYSAAADERLVLFRCGHGFHALCLEPSFRCCVCADKAESSVSVAWPSHSTPPRSETESTASEGLISSVDFPLRLAPPQPKVPDLEGIF